MALYDSIGHRYGTLRHADTRIQGAIVDALGDAKTVVNIGAGTGLYEPHQTVLAIEPSRVMIEQRPKGSARAVQAVAESLPVRDKSVDAALALLTVHHWKDVHSAVAEMRRVAKRRLIFFTRTPQPTHYWLITDYFPSLARIVDEQAARVQELLAILPEAQHIVVPIPHDCTDGFGAAYWRRPQAYLNPDVRSAISMFAGLTPTELQEGLTRLSTDLCTGEWTRKHHDILRCDSLDVGYRVLVSPVG